MIIGYSLVPEFLIALRQKLGIQRKGCHQHFVGFNGLATELVNLGIVRFTFAL